MSIEQAKDMIVGIRNELEQRLRNYGEYCDRSHHYWKQCKHFHCINSRLAAKLKNHQCRRSWDSIFDAIMLDAKGNQQRRCWWDSSKTSEISRSAGWSNSSENLCQQLLRQKSALKAFQSSQIHKIRSAGIREIEARNYADNCCSLNAAAVLYKRLERSYATNRRLGKQRAL